MVVVTVLCLHFGGASRESGMGMSNRDEGLRLEFISLDNFSFHSE